ncbi:MAG TPA: hypothetical protein VN228_01215 [Pyrinomonadaceae bacterium]|nr:hypothetical protein [Pyrinomonadaceae bacterium]
MKVTRVIAALAGLFGLYLLIAGLTSLSSAGAVTLPWVGQKIGGVFLIIVSLVITAGAAVLFLRVGRR